MSAIANATPRQLRQVSDARACTQVPFTICPVDLSSDGAPNADDAQLAVDEWVNTAKAAGIDLSEFDATAPLAERLAWAKNLGLTIATVLSRFSTKLQQSTTAQISDNVRYAAHHKMYVPPEFICVDEGVSGRKRRRAGLDRMKAILHGKHADVLLVFKVSRLFRVAYRGFQFFQEEIVEEGLRAISVSQGIDTADEKSWKLLAYMHGIMDEVLLTTIADHVRSNGENFFKMGYVVGALPIGFIATEVPGAPPTKLGRPRKRPSVDPQTADLIVQHFEWIRDGMPISEGRRRWIAADGPRDPRSKSKHISYGSYRRMLSNPRLTGRWAFGQKRNVWSSKRDCVRQVDRPEAEVVLVESDELRIVSDELFFAVQQRLTSLKSGPRSHKKRTGVELCDLVTDCFVCPVCSSDEEPAPFYKAGADGKAMRCKNRDLCPCGTNVRRADAIRAVCQKLGELIQQDTEIVNQTITSAQRIDAAGDDGFHEQLASIDQQIAVLKRKIDDLTEMAGQGTDDDRASLRAKVRSAQAEKAALQSEQARLRSAISMRSSPITADSVREVLKNLCQLLEDGASGKLGQDAVYRAASLFRQLVGGRIDVQVERRPARTRTNVRGTFVPKLLKTVQAELRSNANMNTVEPEAVSVWLREPPKRDRLAERVHELVDVQKQSVSAAATTLRAEGQNVNADTAWQIYHRYYEMTGQPAPKLAYNNGHPRKARRR